MLLLFLELPRCPQVSWRRPVRLEVSSREVKASKRWPGHMAQAQLQQGLSRRIRQVQERTREPKADVLLPVHKVWHVLTFAPLIYSLTLTLAMKEN